MKSCCKSSKDGNFETSAKLLGLVHQLMSSGYSNHATFDRVNVDGSNVGAVMNITRNDSQKDDEVPGRYCGMNVYISNNIQGVNNSILVGSEVKMVEPGVELCFGDVKWEKEKSNKVQCSQVLCSLRFKVLVLTAVFVLLFGLFGIVCKVEIMKEGNELIKFAT